MRYALRPFVFSLALCCLPAALRADIMVATSLSLTELNVTAPTGTTVQLSLSASAFGSVFDSLGGSDFGYDPGPTTASTSAATTLASWAGAADATANTASSSSGVSIPGTLIAEAGTVPGGNYGDLQGTLEIVAPTDTSVTVNFLAALTGSQDLFTNAYGVSASSEITFNLLVGSTTELFLDNLLQIGPSSSINSPYSSTLTNSDTLQTNTLYFFDANVDAESYGLNAPEPSSVLLIGTIGLLILASRFRRPR
jgi:hypothetical protein